MTEKAPELTANEFNSFIKEGVVLIDFFADWCMPCMMMLPIVEDLADEFDSKAKIAKLNVAEYEELQSTMLMQFQILQFLRTEKCKSNLLVL